MIAFDKLVPGGDRLDARPQEGDSPNESYVRAMFAAWTAHTLFPGLRDRDPLEGV